MLRRTDGGRSSGAGSRAVASAAERSIVIARGLSSLETGPASYRFEARFDRILRGCRLAVHARPALINEMGVVCAIAKTGPRPAFILAMPLNPTHRAGLTKS